MIKLESSSTFDKIINLFFVLLKSRLFKPWLVGNGGIGGKNDDCDAAAGGGGISC